MLSATTVQNQAVQILQASQSDKSETAEKIKDPFDKTFEKIKGTNADLTGVEERDDKVDLAAARLKAREDVKKEALMHGVIMSDEAIDFFATIKVIVNNRQEFGDDEFSVSMELDNGQVFSQTIKSIAFYKAEIFASEVEQNLEKYLASQEEESSLDPEYVKINIMTDIVETMVFDTTEDDTGSEDAADDKIVNDRSTEGQTSQTGGKEFSKAFDSYLEH